MKIAMRMENVVGTSPLLLVIWVNLLLFSLEAHAQIANSSPCRPDEFFCSDSSMCIAKEQVCDRRAHCPDNSDENACTDEGKIRLVSNTRVNLPGCEYGTVLIKKHQEWKSICNHGFEWNESKVVCRSLGYTGGWAVPFAQGYLGEVPNPAWQKNPRCSGHEVGLDECSDGVVPSGYCLPHHDSGVFCSQGAVGVRLTGGEPSNSGGQLELQIGGMWSGVCGTGFDDLDAQVVCRYLGYHGDVKASRGIAGRRGSGTTWNLYLDCLGNESKLEECRVRLTNMSCPFSDVAFVSCYQSAGQMDAKLQAFLPSKCGVAEDASRQVLTRLAKVSRGRTPTRFDTPWLASLRQRKDRRLACGAIIISEDFLLTATHCFNLRSPLSLVVTVGDHNSNFGEQFEEEFFIERVWLHEHYSELSIGDNDVCLLKVERSNGRGIRFGPRVQPVCLPRFGESYENLDSCIVSGWGRIATGFSLRPRPREGRVVIVSDQLCEARTSGGPKNKTSSHVCTLGSPRGAGICSGDSGGPLTCLHQGKHTLYGITSVGGPCGNTYSVGKFVRVTKYLGWILDKMLTTT